MMPTVTRRPITSLPGFAAVAAMIGALASPIATFACAVPNAPPRVVHLAEPGYDQLALQVGARGTFRVHVTVSKTGRAVAASVPGPHPFAGLDHYAIAAALASTYAPARKACAPTQGTLVVRVVFPPKHFTMPERRRDEPLGK